MGLTSSEKNANQREMMRTLIADEESARGNNCEWPGCMISQDLFWHHLDPEIKSFRIKNTRSLHKSVENMRRELAKCKLVCEGHHLLDHAYLILGIERPW